MNKFVIKIFSLLCVFNIMISCKSSTSNSFSYVLKDNGNRKEIQIPDSLYSFYDNENVKFTSISQSIAGLNSQGLYKPEYFEIKYIFEMVKLSKDVQIIKNDLKRMSLEVLSSEKDDYHIIYEQREILKEYNDLDSIKNTFFIGEIPYFIPKFPNGLFLEELKNEIYYDESTKCNLPKDYNIYVMKYGFTNIFTENNESKEWNIMPDSIRHGYSSGVAFNEIDPYIIFWVIAW